MATRSGVLARWHSVAAGVSNGVFTVPVTDTWIAKDLRMWNAGAGAVTLTVTLTSADGLETMQLYNTSLPAGSKTGFTTAWWALGPGDSITFTADNPGARFWLSGADLPGHL